MTDYCVHCGRIAVVFNDLNQPACPVCRSKAPKEISCDICSAMMIVKQGKFGSFWACSGYPQCNNSMSIKKQLMKNWKK